MEGEFFIKQHNSIKLRLENLKPTDKEILKKSSRFDTFTIQ